MIKQVLIFVAGLVTGGGAVGLFVHNKYIRKDIHEKELEDMKAYYIRESGRRYDPRPRPTVKKEEVTDNPIPYKKPETDDYTRYFKKEAMDAATMKAMTTDPADLEHPLEEDDYEEDYSQGLAMKREREKAKSKGPKLIPASDFGSESYQDTVTLLYYMDDGVITNEDEEVYDDLDEVEAMLGDTLRKYGFDSNDEKSIYVRNVERGCDYEIIKVFSSYSDN